MTWTQTILDDEKVFPQKIGQYSISHPPKFPSHLDFPSFSHLRAEGR